MDSDRVKELLDGLITEWENEVVEFKQANDNFSTDEIGRYFSALANEANLNHLDDNAVRLARESFAKKHANRIEPAEVMAWPVETFLDRAFVTRDGRVTRAALLLLGRPESTYLLSPHPAHMVWNLVGSERAYEHFGPPFLRRSRLHRTIDGEHKHST